MNKKNRYKDMIFILSIISIAKVVGSCTSLSNKNADAEIESNSQNKDEELAINTRQPYTNGYESIQSPLSTTLSEIQHLAKDPSFIDAMNNFKNAYSDLKFKPDESYTNIIEAVKNGVKLGIFSEHFEKIFTENQIHDGSSLVANILCLEQITEEIDTTDSTYQERLGEIQSLIIKANLSIQIIENFINENRDKSILSAEDRDIILKKSNELKNLLIYKEYPIHHEIEQNANNTTVNIQNFLFGQINPEYAITIGEYSQIYKNATAPHQKSILNHWMQSKALRTGSWDSSIGIETDENKIAYLCKNIQDLFEIYKSTNTEYSLEDLQARNKDFPSILEKGEIAIQKLRKILKYTDTFTDIADNTSRYGLRWVGKWRKDGIEKQISTEEAIQLSSILD